MVRLADTEKEKGAQSDAGCAPLLEALSHGFSCPDSPSRGVLTKNIIGLGYDVERHYWTKVTATFVGTRGLQLVRIDKLARCAELEIVRLEELRKYCRVLGEEG